MALPEAAPMQALPPLSSGYDAAFVIVIIAALLQTANAPPSVVARGGLGFVIVASVTCALLGTWGLRVVAARANDHEVRMLFGALLFLACAATWVSRGHAAMALLAVVSGAVIYLRVHEWVLVSALASFVAVLAYAVNMTLMSALIQALVNFGSAVAFIIVFSRLIVRERRARADLVRLTGEVEALAQERERNRIARDVHDGLGHYLTTVHMQLEAAQALLSSDSARTRVAIETAQRLTREGLLDIRRTVALLRSPSRPLTEAVGSLADVSVLGSPRVDVVVHGAPRPLTDSVEFALYRAAQEGTTNSRRHACASQVHITLIYGEERVRLLVEDDGVGVAEEGVGAGFGLLGLRERIEQVGGRVVVTESRDHGFLLDVEVPG